MTDTVPANATGLPDCRLFLSTIAGAGALGLPRLPAMAWTPSPIEAMWPEHLRLEAEYDAACGRTAALLAYMAEVEGDFADPGSPLLRTMLTVARGLSDMTRAAS